MQIDMRFRLVLLIVVAAGFVSAVSVISDLFSHVCASVGC